MVGFQLRGIVAFFQQFLEISLEDPGNAKM
jgi:hypothetical protein